METVLNLLTIGVYVMLFIKIGEPWWYGMIPVFRNYILYGWVWSTTYFWIYLLCSISIVIGIFTGYTLLAVLCYIACLVMDIYVMVRLSYSMKDGKIYAIAIIALSIVSGLMSM